MDGGDHGASGPFAARTLIGGATAGTGHDAVRVDVLVGRRGGPLETAWATALVMPRAGKRTAVAELHPGLAVRPATLFAATAELRGDRHEELTMGPAHAAVAGGVARAVEEGLLPREDVADVLVVAATHVDPDAADADAVFSNALAATYEAIAAAVHGTPTVEEVLAAARHPWNDAYHRHRN
jgi:5,6,7,8-tetrahydromethanopterin hydro-lyase